MFHGKTHYKWPFSIAMLNYQRVSHDEYEGDFRSRIILARLAKEQARTRDTAGDLLTRVVSRDPSGSW